MGRGHGLLDLEKSLASIGRRVELLPKIKGHTDYANDPVGYAKNVIKINPSPDQIAVAEALRTPPYRVLVPSGHKSGKSLTAAWLINWFYDSNPVSRCISTAPTMASVTDIVWSEVRMMRHRAGLGGLQPKAPELSDGPGHVARGITASSGEAFQGRHSEKIFIVFDEACGIDPVFWQTARSMVKPEQGHMWLALFNPTDTTSQAYWEDQSVEEDGSPRWATVRMDCLRHPNIVAQLQGLPPPIPSAVTLPMISEWLGSYGCELRSPGQQQPTDLEWPPGSGKFYREGPEWQARCRGMWPEGGTYAIWSEALCRQIMAQKFPWNPDILPEIGCDVARFGDDYTAIHVRWGDNSCSHEARNGWSTVQTAARVRELCEEWADRSTSIRDAKATPTSPHQIQIKIDDDGVGGGVVDILRSQSYCVVPIGAGTKSATGKYPNKRSELWFHLAERARAGRLGMSQLDAMSQNRLRQQFMTVLWQMHSLGRVVEPKDSTKKRIGRSPDDADAANLAYYECANPATAQYISVDAGDNRGFGLPEASTRKRKIYGA